MPIEDGPREHQASKELKTPAVSKGGRSGKELAHQILFFGFLGCAVVWLLFQRQQAPQAHELDALVLMLAAAATIAGLARDLPLENALMAGVFVAAISSLVEILGVWTHFPFGSRFFTIQFGPQLFHLLPWPLPLLWVVIVLNSREVARLILSPWRKLRHPGLWVIGLAAVLAVLVDLGLEPFAADICHFWYWRTPRSQSTWYSAPWINFAAWWATTIFALIFSTPWLIRKKPAPAAAPVDSPLILWCCVTLLLGAANKIHGLPRAASLGATTTFIVALLAWNGLRRPSRRPDADSP